MKRMVVNAITGNSTIIDVPLLEIQAQEALEAASKNAPVIKSEIDQLKDAVETLTVQITELTTSNGVKK